MSEVDQWATNSKNNKILLSEGLKRQKRKAIKERQCQPEPEFVLVVQTNKINGRFRQAHKHKG